MSLNPIFRYVPSKGCHTEYISDSKGHKNKYLIFLSIIITHNDEKGNDASISDPVCCVNDGRCGKSFGGKVGGRGEGALILSKDSILIVQSFLTNGASLVQK